MPRPTDQPSDGACESGHTCLGLLGSGTYHTKVFRPGFAFTISTPGWENLADEGGDFGLLSIDSPGDGIYFFRQARATTPDGLVVADVPSTAKALEDWLVANPTLTASPAVHAPIGGLDGDRLEFTIAPGVVAHQSDCPVQVCVPLFRGRDPSSKPTWTWDWGSAGPERQRVYLLSAKDGVVAIFVDSLDGTTFDSLTKAADTILATVRFDGS